MEPSIGASRSLRNKTEFFAALGLLEGLCRESKFIAAINCLHFQFFDHLGKMFFLLIHPSVTGPQKALHPLFFKPPKKFCMPLIFEFFLVPPNFQMSPCIILSCPHIILFG